jgi:eukaryotic-like serine/threonine-protein kinase
VTRVEADSYVEAFEAARARDGGADFAAHLPGRDHPLYQPVLRELACVELELSRVRGQARRLEDYRAAYPELFEDRECLAALAYQEYRLRRESGEDVGPAEYRERYGLDTDGWPEPRGGAAGPGELRQDWREQAAALYENYRRVEETRVTSASFFGSVEHADLLLELQRGDSQTARLFADAVPRPEAGADFAGFRLVRELGRGTFGRVFLAEQTGLADRLVALKVGDCLVGESQTLARVQHTNIVPIYSAHQAGPLQAVCMPYLGATTLQDVLDQMRRQGGAPGGGNAVWNTLHRQTAATRTDPDQEPPAHADGRTLAPARPAPAALEGLRALSHVRAVLWIGARLADGLGHAHERGILHRDLKPANVLLGDDGTPLLLDFNLSADVRLRGGLPALLGGTLLYMAPEHLETFQGGTRPVDARSDVYALGLVLYELLTGRPPFPAHEGPLREQIPRLIADRLAGAPAVRPYNRTVTPAVEALLRRCLDPDPDHRYQSARHLQEDAQRQLDDLPLRHTPEPSLRERGRKWARRHPRLTWAGGAAALAMLLLAVGQLYLFQSRQLARVEAANALHHFREEVRDAEILLSLPAPDQAELAEGEELCRRALARYGLPDQSAWERTPAFANLPPDEQAEVRGDCGELLLLLVRPVSLRAAGGVGLEEALRLNALAETCFREADSQRVLVWQRARLVRLAGREEEARELSARAEAAPPRARRDYFLLGGEKAGQGHLREALRLLREAGRLAPDRAAVWTARGACHAALGQFDKAAACFETSVALRPDFWRGYLWRGQANLELKDHESARDDFAAALRLRPDFAPAHFLRALARLGLKDFRGADEDLTRALELDPGHTRLYFTRSRVRALTGDRDGARRDFAEGLRREPADELSWTARGEARLGTDPRAALADFDAALRLNPWSRNAAQNKAHVLAEKLGRTGEAVAVLDRLVERYPDFVPARAGRGVLLARLGQRERALQDAGEALRRDTGALNLYQAACVYALTSRQEPGDRLEAFRLLARALKTGFGADLLETDPDLASLRHLPEFRGLVELARAFRKAD